ncbi:MAG TPA: DUF4382 domain-containing protein [Povalibacter sp.]|nr:DUF4382 domain-containing protein [Povalibacter sp.]
MFSLLRFRPAWACALALAGLLALVACGGGGGGSMSSSGPPSGSGSSSCPSADCGSVYIAMTDADGDFLSYTVDVVSLTLKRANGAIVETLPATTRIDFAQYVDLTEFLTAATVPRGDYVQGTLRLDYSNADITVEKNGAPVAAQAVDANGQPLGVVDVNVTLDNRHHLVVAPGLPSLFTLDFNLAATNTVDLTTTPATVTVTPALVASLELVDQKDLRVRGPLVSVDTTAGTYVVDVRPFNMRAAQFGQVTVHTDDSTNFEINGTTYTGSTGLQALATAGAGTPTVAFGTLTTATREFDATTVNAGTSVPGAGIDTVMGDVVARSGNSLTVRGATIVRNSDGARFVRGSVTVTIGADTKVVKSGTVPALTVGPEAISVGQSIAAFGTATPVDPSVMRGDWTLNATAGRVRMRETRLYGFVNQAADGELSLKLDSIGGRRISAFNFAGTGATTADDADPMNYQVSTGSLDLSRLSAGEPTRVIGFPTAFGMAPPDFDARTLVDQPALPALLQIGWGMSGTTTPFTSQEAGSLVLNLANPAIGGRHSILIGPRHVDLLSLPASPIIVPPGDGRTAYLIVMQGMSESFHDFGDFVTSLGQHLNGSTVMLGLTASGSYDGNSNVLTARTIVVVLK